MKRSNINEALQWAKDLLEKSNIKLPPFGYWTMDQWKEHKDELDTIKQTMLGWDITDYGKDDFANLGGVLFTLRNGDVHNTAIGTPYAEKLILLKEGQALPCHFHYKKTEDIIVRSSGVMGIKLYNATKDYEVDTQSDVEVYMDGIKHTVKAGETILVHPGCSITLTPFMYHTFFAQKGYGDCVIGEVSSINDDNVDNHFNPEMPRFSKIEEDEAITHPLCNEYNLI